MKDYKLKIKVTKDILGQSMMCGTKYTRISLESMQEVQSNCAIALACREIFKECYVGCSRVDAKKFFIRDSEKVKDVKWRIALPETAVTFVRLFDKTSPQDRLLLPELEFEVTLPQEYIDSINVDEIRELLKDSKTLEIIS